MNYEYDGTFFGYLSAVFDAWHQGIHSVGLIRPAGQLSLFDKPLFVISDPGKAERILNSLKKQCGGKTCHFLYYAFMAESPCREEQLLTYMQLAFRYKETFLQHLSDEPIWAVRQLARKTSNERHKLLGLLRFRELDTGMLYARLAPVCSVVPLMAPHFAARLPEEIWVIHDVRRRFGVFYDGHELMMVDIPKVLQKLGTSADEKQYSMLWRQYYHTMTIQKRRNENVRRSFMPKRYWPWLIEDVKHS